MNTFFEKATPVWLKGLEAEKTVTMGLYTALNGEKLFKGVNLLKRFEEQYYKYILS